MNTEQIMKQNLEFSQELRCWEAKNIISCKILCIFPNSAKNFAGARSQNPGGTVA